MAEIPIGARAEATELVTKEVTAQALGSGVALVLATPWMISFMERTSVKALAPYMGENDATVGIHVNVAHKKAAPMGKNVITEAEVVEIDRRRIVFAVKTLCDGEIIGEGTHERFLIDKAKFSEKNKSV